MSLIRLAVHTRRWDLAACAIILATLKYITDGEKRHGGKAEPEEERPGQFVSPA